VNGRQVEVPDYWLAKQICFEVPREDFVERYQKNGKECARWRGGEVLQAMAYDNPVPGYGTYNYERKLLNAFCQIPNVETKSMSPRDRQNVQKRFSCIGGKAAPGYYQR